MRASGLVINLTDGNHQRAKLISEVYPRLSIDVTTSTLDFRITATAKELTTLTVLIGSIN